LGLPRVGLRERPAARTIADERASGGQKGRAVSVWETQCVFERGSIMCIRRSRRGFGGFCVGVIAAMLATTTVRAGTTQEQPLIESVPADSTFRVSKDGRFCYVIEPAPNNQKVLVSNDEPGKPYDDIGLPVYQSNGQKDRMVYAAKLNNQCFYVDRGAEGDPYDDVGPAFISPDTSQVFYAAYFANTAKWCPILNNQIGQPCDEVGTPTFSPNGKHLAYAVRTGAMWNLILDNNPEPPCDGIGTVSYSPDSKHVAYDSITNNKHTIVFNGKPGPAFDAILPGTPFYTTDNLSCVYFGQKDGKWTYVVNNVEAQLGPYDDVSVPMFKSDNKHYMFVAAKGQSQMVVYDGAEGQPYDAIDPASLHFNPDVNNSVGYQYVYQASQNMKQLPVYERWPNPTSYDAVVASTLNFTPDGKSTYYWAQDNGNWLWRNDRHTVNLNDAYSAYKVGPTPFASDSKRTMYAYKDAATNGLWGIMIDGNPLPDLYDDVDESQMVFTADARHTIFVAKSKGAWKVVIDGVAGPDYDEIVTGGGPILQADGSIFYYAIKKGDLVRAIYTF
jgi:hypothetical protein